MAIKNRREWGEKYGEWSCGISLKKFEFTMTH